MLKTSETHEELHIERKSPEKERSRARHFCINSSQLNDFSSVSLKLFLLLAWLFQ